MKFLKLFGLASSLISVEANFQVFNKLHFAKDTTELAAHPVVQGNANVINLEVRSNNDYTGHLYIGSE